MRDRNRNLLIGAAAAIGAIYLAADTKPVMPEVERGIKRVRVAAVEAAAERRELRFSGVTRAARHARLAFSIGGRMVARSVDVGDRVEAGEVLARLDARELDNAVATARGALAEVAARRAQAERDLERARSLAEAKAATEEELEQVRAGLDAARAAEDAARARLAEAERMLGEAALEAPYAGTVTEVTLEPGEYAGPGRTVVVFSGHGELELEVEVPESVVPHVERGVEAQVAVPFMGRTVTGRVSSVGQAAAGPGRLFPVVVTIPEASGVVVGATAELVLALAADGALAVPVEAVVNPGGRRPAVFRLVDGDEPRVRKVGVEVGTLLGDRVVVRAAADELAAGDLVVVGGQRGLLDGEVVDVEKTSEEPQ